jgi:hypothetical protein
MNAKFWISTAVMFVVAMMLGFLVHGFLLHNDYMKIPQLMRTQEEQAGYFGFMILGHVFMAAGLVWVYTKGREAGKSWVSQGFKYGIALAILITLPTYLIYYAVMPFPADLVAQQIVFDSIAMVLMALVVAWLYR